jgi:hypothetical protein
MLYYCLTTTYPERGCTNDGFARTRPFRRDTKLWTVTAVKWVLENISRYELLARLRVKNPAEEEEITTELETVEAPDLERAVAAPHTLLDKHAHEAGDIGLELYVVPPDQPYADQERLGVRHYKLSAKARKQARAVGIRGGDLEVRIARIVRHAAPFKHKTGNLRFRGLVMRLEHDDAISRVRTLGQCIRAGYVAGQW